MSTSPGTVNLTATLQGLTQEGGPVGPVDLGVELAAQAYTFETKDYRVPVSASLPGSPSTIAIPAIPAGLRQSLFLLSADQPIEFQLNGDASITYEHRAADRFYLVMGPPTITQLDLGNLSGVEARLYILQVVEPTS